MFFCQKCDNSYDITSQGKNQSGGSFDKLIQDIIDEKEVDTKNIDLHEVQKTPKYKKLSVAGKELILNKISDSIPVKKKEVTKLPATGTPDVFFECDKCGFREKVKEKTLIYMNNSIESRGEKNINYNNIIHSKIKTYTRKYICPNKKCDTNKDPTLKEAMIFRSSVSTYRMRYLCMTCETSWYHR